MTRRGRWTGGQTVRHERHGVGRVVADVGETVVVRFDGPRLEQLPTGELRLTSSLHDALEARRVEPEADALLRARALAITSVNGQWGVFSRSLIELLPHQLWVCRKVTGAWPFRWLVADDVGLGKTIECGLVLMPLIASGQVRRLLILAPARLVPQWQARLKQMFDVRVQQYVTAADRRGGLFWDTTPMVVGSFHTLRGKKRGVRDRLLEADPWDLVVVDEAHHFGSNRRTGRTLAYKLLEELEERRKIHSLLLFTGTPHRGKDFQFYSLMRLVRPDLFDPDGDRDENLAHLRKAMIRNNKASVTNLHGGRIFTSVTTEKRDYSYSPAEAHFYETLSRFISEGRAYAASFGGRAHTARGLLLTTLQKLAASSVAAVRNALAKRRQMLEHERAKRASGMSSAGGAVKLPAGLGESSDEGAEAEEKALASVAGLDLVHDEIERLTELVKLSRAIDRETKIDRLISMIEEDFPSEPILLFTEYKATQALVVNALHERFDFDSCAFINGDERLEGVKDRTGRRAAWIQSREGAAKAFNAGVVRFLVSTEAGGEGIDLQERCAVLVHVDLPWNPMRLHQRVGRLSRYGQKRDVTVRILRNPDTVESRIWELLEQKLERVQEAFAQTMEDPEDITHLVIGMTGNNLFNEIFSNAPDLEEERLGSWFDGKTAQLGGVEVTDAARQIVGSAARFDFRGVGADLPQVDLPDLREFVKGAVRRHGRRIREEESGLAFLSPTAWTRKHYAVRHRYDSLVFDRGTRGGGALARVLGVGHPVLDTALREALDLDVRVARVTGLASAVLVVSVEDQVTGLGAQAPRLVLGVRDSGGKRKVLRDWELLRLFNECGSHRSVETAGTLAPGPTLTSWVDDGLRTINVSEIGGIVGMRQPGVWPEMLLLPAGDAGP